LKKDCWSRKGKQGDGKHENNQEPNVVGDMLQDALILSLDNIIDSWVVDLGLHFMLYPIGNIFKTMFKLILDKFIW
jgi:hypothetical protein